MFCFCAGFFSAFENIILLAVNLCQLPFNSSHVKANHRTTDAKLPHRAALMCLCAGPLEAVGSIHRCCTGTVLGSSVVSFFSGCLREEACFSSVLAVTEVEASVTPLPGIALPL